MITDQGFTHYINDPATPTRALVFQAYECDTCGGIHRRANTEDSVMPWILAATNLTQLHLDGIPEAGCPKWKNNA